LPECLALLALARSRARALARCAVNPARCALATQPHTQCAAPDAYTASGDSRIAPVVRWLFTHPLLLLTLLASLALGVVYGADAFLFCARAAPLHAASCRP
jgi:hypothetical protein